MDKDTIEITILLVTLLLQVLTLIKQIVIIIQNRGRVSVSMGRHLILNFPDSKLGGAHWTLKFKRRVHACSLQTYCTIA